MDKISLCLCAQCKSPDKIECVGNNVRDPADFFPAWMQNAPYYERERLCETYKDVQQVSCFKHYVSMIIHTIDDTRRSISASDLRLGRMHRKIMIFDLIRMREFELTFDQDTSVEGLTAAQVCDVWPQKFMVIDQNWAILVGDNSADANGTCFILMLLATDYNSKNFAVKDSMIIWNEPEHRVDSQSFSNLVRGEGPTCAVTLSNAFFEQGRQRWDFVHTIFVSFNIHEQKLTVVKNVAGNLLSWPCTPHICLISWKMYGFETRRVDMGQFWEYMVNFNQLQMYSVDGEENNPAEIKELLLPANYEHELGLRYARSPELVQIHWSKTGCDLTVAARPPFCNKTWTFILDISTLSWHKLDVPGFETSLHSNLRLLGFCLDRFSWFTDDQTLILCGGHMVIGRNTKQEMSRWYRVKIKRPASLFELAFCRATTSNNSKLRLLTELNIFS